MSCVAIMHDGISVMEYFKPGEKMRMKNVSVPVYELEWSEFIILEILGSF